MASIAGEAYLNFPASLDGLVNLDANNITINGVTITGNYLNSKSNTSDVNTVISLASGAEFTIKDTSNNELIKCDNATSFTNFYRPRTTFTGQNQADDIPNLLYGLNTYWFKSGSNGISGAFQTASSGSIWFQNDVGQTFILMQGTGVQVNNPTLTNTINLYTLYNTYGGSNQLLMIDNSGNMQNAPNLSYTYGDINATIKQTVPSNIGGQQQYVKFTRDFTVNGLYGWKLTAETESKVPLVETPMTINNLYSNEMYPTSLVINGINTLTELRCNKINSNNSLLTLTNNNNINFTIDNDRFKFFNILDIRAFISSPLYIQYNVPSSYSHVFSVNNSSIFTLANVLGVPTIVSNGYFTLIDNGSNKVYTDGSGLYCQGSGGGYFLANNLGSAFLVSSSNSSLAMVSTGVVSLSASVGGNLSLNQGASLYSKTGFTCSLGVNNTNIISVYDDQHGNDTIFFSRNTNDPNILFGTDITANNVIGQATSNGSFSTDALAGDLVIRNNSKNIRLGTAGAGASHFVINSSGNVEVNTGTFTTSNTIEIQTTSLDRETSLKIETGRAGILLISNLSGAVQWNFWSGGTAESFGSAWYLYNNSDGAFRFTVQATGDVYLNNYTTNGTLSVAGGNGKITSSSDIRLKENVNYITDTKKGLDQILGLKPCQFNFKANKEHTQLGLIAQDVEQIIPIVVDGKKYEYQAKRDINNKLMYDEEGNVVYELDEQGNKKIRPRGLDYNGISATQILAIQELHKQLLQVKQESAKQYIQQKQIIDEQKQHITTLQDNMSVMFKQMETMTNVINKLTEKINAM